MSSRIIRSALITMVLIMLASPLLAATTKVKVQVRAVDAKFIGSGVGNMNVVIKNAQTGALLATGEITGATGDTQALMQQGQTRGHAPVTPETAAFSAAIDIDQPTLVEIRITGPLAVPQSIRNLSVTQWLLPGQDLDNPGIVLQLPGLIITPVDIALSDDELHASVDVTMLCGCPISKGGLWNSEDFSVQASLYQQDKLMQSFPLAFTGKTNRFAGKLAAPKQGSYELWISAYEKRAENTGVWHQQLDIH